MGREVGQLAIFTRELFSTPHDTANRAAVAAVPAGELDLVLAEIQRSRPLGDEGGYDRLPIGAAAEDSRRRLAEVGIAPLPQPGERNV